MTPPARARRRARRTAPAVLLAATALLVSACNNGSGGDAAGGGGGAASPTPTIPVPAVKLTDSGEVSYRHAVTMKVTDGTLTSVQVTATKNRGAAERALEGTVAGDGLSWASEAPPHPGTTYTATAVVQDAAKKSVTQKLKFKVGPVPDDKKLSFTVTPDDGQTVGIGQPVVVRFLSPVTKRANVEKALDVTAKTPGGASVEGSWHWLNSQQVDWRPKEFWKPGTKVKVAMNIAGVHAGDDLYGRKDYSESFTIGASHITKVDAKSDRVKVYRDGELVDTWPTGTGRPGLETYSGTYVVLGKSQVVQMDSCSARITCDKKDSDYYDEKEYWATRITASGTFLHAASWDGRLGYANTSHGCIHLSDANAEEFYNHAVDGDVVIVSNTGRGPQERIDTQDPGLYDWNLSWKSWTKGSAL